MRKERERKGLIHIRDRDIEIGETSMAPTIPFISHICKEPWRLWYLLNFTFSYQICRAKLYLIFILNLYWSPAEVNWIIALIHLSFWSFWLALDSHDFLISMGFEKSRDLPADEKDQWKEISGLICGPGMIYLISYIKVFLFL